MSFAVTSFVCGVRATGRGVMGFTLLELLVVLALVAALCVAYFNGFGGGQSAALQSAQAILTEIILEARGRALASGHETRVLLSCGATGAPSRGRFLRCLVVQELADDGTWSSAAITYLPRGTAIVPPEDMRPAGLLTGPEAWMDSKDAPLVSTALQSVSGPTTVPAFPDDRWCALNFDPEGSVETGGGNVVIAPARPEPADTSCPLRCPSARAVRGVLLSRYGVPVSLNGWGDF